MEECLDQVTYSPRRWLVLVGTMLCQMGFGSIYTWSLFNAPLGQTHGWAVEQVAFSFSISALALAVGTLFSGNLQQTFGERKVAVACAIILGAGLITAAHMTSLWALYLTAGLIVGMADGIGYMMTLTNCIKWFPDKKGMISGFAIGAYGIGSFVFKYVNGYLLDSFGVMEAFLYWGIITFVIILLGSFLLKDAPVPKAVDLADKGEGTHEFTRKELLRCPQAWLLFVAFTGSCLGGLYVISIAKDVGMAMAGLTAAQAATAIAIIALANTAARFVVGVVSDYLERTKIVAVMFWVMILSVALILFKDLNYAWLLISIGGMAFAFGGNLSIFPVITSEFFGLRNSSKNYGLIYQGFGIGGILGGLVANATGSMLPTFYLILVFALAGSFIMMFITSPHR
ncbi:MAG: OFA family MFS transporter [Veillonella sp.]|nr:OFA family MFS transporter [Veillonella sp.]